MQEPLSPELALVDPELAARARAALPELRLDDIAPRPVAALRPAAAEAPRARPHVRALRAAAAVVFVASLTLNADLLFERRSTAEAEAPPASSVTSTLPKAKAPGGVKAAVEVRKPKASPPTLKLPKTPRSTRPAVSAATLRWPASSAARSYDVVLWRGHRRVLDVWTTRPHVDLRTLPCIQRRPLAAGGRYLWFVYPQLQIKPKVRFGRLIRWGVLDVPRGGLSCGRATGARSTPASPSRRP
jgi:hypothetical protein